MSRKEIYNIHAPAPTDTLGPVATLGASSLIFGPTSLVFGPEPANSENTAVQNMYNEEFIKKIDMSIKNIMRDGKVDKYDIPEFVLLFTTLLTSNFKIKEANLHQELNKLFDYIMNKYKLLPNDDIQKENFKLLFEMSIKLVLYKPQIKKLFCCIN